MLTDLLGAMQAQPTLIEQASDIGTDLSSMFNGVNALGEGSSAQFSAGFLYGASKQTVDLRDYIVDCAIELPWVTKKLGDGFNAYNSGKLQKGNKKLNRFEAWQRTEMLFCPRAWKPFIHIHNEKMEFLNRDDWPELARQNYDNNKDAIDADWENALKTWNEGVPFNAGMFYGRVVTALAYIPEELRW